MWTGNSIALYQKAAFYNYFLLYYLVAILYEYVQTFQSHLGQLDDGLNNGKKTEVTLTHYSKHLVQCLDTSWT